MRQIDRYVLGQLLGPLGFFALIFTGVFWLTQSLRIVDTVVNNNQSAAVFLELSALLLPNVMSIVLPISALAATLFAINRLYSESELTVMIAAGQSPAAMARPALYLGLVATVLTAALTLYLAPRAESELRERREALKAELANSLLREGQFNHPVSGVTVYLRQANSEGRMLDIFIHDAREPGQSITYTASQAQLTRGDGRLQLVLFDGAAQQFADAGRQLSVLDFDRFAYDLGPTTQETVMRRPRASDFGIATLLDPPYKIWNGNTAFRDELFVTAHERMSEPLYALAFPMLGIAAVLGGPFRRGGSSRRIVVAVALAIGARSAGIAAVSAAERTPEIWPLLYVIPLALLAGSFAYLSRPRGRRKREAAA
ncbi:LPS export ABC transporter permease LptF [Roseobacter sp. HKCCA0434]|uniref:LPS export ABC transporter permease LptF n=1 Tax=Roseobacter sp. HKCCA0434 TaxID=3079297 RepID=UPI0029058C40|nr:LPS export ABC transporter permease LptF [Roseobacter sp. HKCCA0434]